jgi:hypothetical protein
MLDAIFTIFLSKKGWAQSGTLDHVDGRVACLGHVLTEYPDQGWPVRSAET